MTTEKGISDLLRELIIILDEAESSNSTIYKIVEMGIPTTNTTDHVSGCIYDAKAIVGDIRLKLSAIESCL